MGRLRRQGEVTRTQQLRTQGLLSSSNHRVSRRRLAGKFNKDGTLNKEWQAKQDAAKAAKQARWKANSGAEARLRRQGEVKRTQQLRTQGLLSSTNHRASRRRLAGKYNKDGTINKEWQAKQDAAKAAKQARWKANSGAEARLRRQGEVTRT